MGRASVSTIVKKYGNVLKRNNFSYSKIYLFGSYAKGKARADSDIDVAVVISGNVMTNWLKKIKLWQLARQVDTRIEPILINNCEFNRGRVSQMAHEVKTSGRVVI